MPRPLTRTSTRLALLFAAPLLAPGCGGESGEYPSRPVFIICPWGAGGGTDRVSRFLAKLFEDETGESFSVVNRTGGGGVTGHTAGARAKPNGHTLLTITVEIVMMHHRGLTSIGPGNFEPVIMVNRDAAAVFVRGDSPWQTFEDLRREAAASPGSLRASGTALGGIWHLALAGLLGAAGLPGDAIRWVPSEGAASGLLELLSGNIHVVCCSLPEASSQLDSGQVRCLGVMGKRRVARFPEVPTMIEQGVDWTLGGWRGLALPQGTPPRTVERVVDLARRVTATDEFLEFMTQQGFDVAIEGPEEFGRTMAADDEKFGRLIAEHLAPADEGESAVPGPWFFPALLAGALAAAGFALALHGIPLGGRARIVEVVAAVVFYLLVADVLGFLLTGAVITLYLLRRLGNGWVASIAVTVVFVPAVYAVFGKLMDVPLPGGPIPW